MRLNDIERLLSSVPAHPAPKAELEQYATPADLAAPLLFEARSLGDIEGRSVADLGCGTGIFAIGASLMGAASVSGVDVDPGALALARESAQKLGAHVEWVEGDVSSYHSPVDTVLMNPPFGAQLRHADRAFLDTAMRVASVVYTLHHAPTRAFVEAYSRERGFAVTHAWALAFPLRHQYRHQTKAVRVIDVVALRLMKTR